MTTPGMAVTVTFVPGQTEYHCVKYRATRAFVASSAVAEKAQNTPRIETKTAFRMRGTLTRGGAYGIPRGG